MSRKFISTILAATLAVTAFASKPARAASEEDIARILAGAATIFIIGKAIQSSRDNDKDDKKSKSHKDRKDRDRYKPQKHTSRKHHRYDRHDHGRPYYGTRPTPLPQHCRVTARTRNGHETLFGARCLDRSYQSARRLPGECLRDVRWFRGERQAYSGNCLRAHGYTTAGRQVWHRSE
ncbi:hypothetical protein [Primorskyibacter marinus]|uniref:hypothetical protein n=1 Tax=Primorskyibacter marinus TaxID=1977320 RepID=UPI001300A5DA|nr:hypothetical protein [Primorskyibacter marinus]